MIMRREQAQILLQNVEKLELAMIQQPQVPCPVVHHFGPGIYMREVTIPAGTFAVGHHQNFEHVSLLLKGRLTIIHDDGTVSDLTAPMIFPNWPAGRKISFAHEDMVWMNVYNTDETDIEKLEETYLTKSQCFVEAQWLKSKLKKLETVVDRADFLQVLKDLKTTEEEVRTISIKDTDIHEFGSYKAKVSHSPIEGRGLFATSDIEVGAFIMPARIHGQRTIAGRFTNHSKNPNAKMVRGPVKDIHLIAVKSILGCHGGIDGDEITIDYREAVKLNLEIAREV